MSHTSVKSTRERLYFDAACRADELIFAGLTERMPSAEELKDMMLFYKEHTHIEEYYKPTCIPEGYEETDRLDIGSIQRDDSIILIWEQDGYCFEITGFLPEEDAVNMAQSIAIAKTAEQAE